MFVSWAVSPQPGQSCLPMFQCPVAAKAFFPVSSWWVHKAHSVYMRIGLPTCNGNSCNLYKLVRAATKWLQVTIKKWELSTRPCAPRANSVERRRKKIDITKKKTPCAFHGFLSELDWKFKYEDLTPVIHFEVRAPFASRARAQIG